MLRVRARHWSCLDALLKAPLLEGPRVFETFGVLKGEKNSLVVWCSLLGILPFSGGPYSSNDYEEIVKNLGVDGNKVSR
jgi:hypothetical protein